MFHPDPPVILSLSLNLSRSEYLGGEKNLAADFEKQHKTPFAHGGVHFDAAPRHRQVRKKNKNETSRGSTKSSSCRGV